jgi:hypothetical protein
MMPTFIRGYTYYYHSMSIIVSSTIYRSDGGFDSNFFELFTMMPTFIRGYTYYYHSMVNLVLSTIFGLDGELDSNSFKIFTTMIL